MKNKASALNEKLEKLTKKRDQERVQIEKDISLCTEEIKKLEDEAHTLEKSAISEKNFEKYQSAKIALEEAKDKEELYKKHYQALKVAPIISPEEMEREIKELLSDTEANSKERRTRAAALIAELEKIAEEERAEIMDVNGVLFTMTGNNRSFYSNVTLPRFIDSLHKDLKSEYEALTGHTAPRVKFTIYNTGSFLKSVFEKR